MEKREEVDETKRGCRCLSRFRRESLLRRAKLMSVEWWGCTYKLKPLGRKMDYHNRRY